VDEHCHQGIPDVLGPSFLLLHDLAAFAEPGADHLAEQFFADGLGELAKSRTSTTSTVVRRVRRNLGGLRFDCVEAAAAPWLAGWWKVKLGG
jgi:hypothetical protein